MSTNTELIGCVQHDCAKCKAQADAIEALEASQERNTKYTLALQDDALKLQTEVERLKEANSKLASSDLLQSYEAMQAENAKLRDQLAAAQGQEPACPVCQARPEFSLDRRVGEWSGRCKHCGVDGSPAPTEAEAIRKWIVWHHKKSDSAAPIPQQPSVPEGWKLVPIEPSNVMIIQGEHALQAESVGDFHATAAEIRATWRAMCAAAPQPKETK